MLPTVPVVGEVVKCKQCYECVTRKRIPWQSPSWPQCTQTNNTITDCGVDRIECDSGNFRLIQTYLYPEQWDFQPKMTDSYCLNGSRILSPPADSCVSLSQLQQVFQTEVDSYTITDGTTGQEKLGEVIGTACFCQTWPCKKHGIVKSDVTTEMPGPISVYPVTETENNACSNMISNEMLYFTVLLVLKLWIIIP
ncbi:uncharacterized protein [Amphiura filiformis]|uniref:uncharacterized protein isoform X2 n=1 Tax=Amphiura filiformis TaxID=82378 RepID=UPI003B20C975